MELFFANEASYAIEKYQREVIGDKDIQFSKWKKRPSSHPPSFDRVVNFIHPLKNSVGPSQAKTTRQQHFRRFGNYGMSLQNSTVVEGIPAADCFRVEDRWTIERVSGEESLKMAVSFRIVFMKRTMFKPIIQKNIRQETKNWFRGYASMLQRALTDDGKKGVASTEPLPSTPVESDAVETTTNALTEGSLKSVSHLELMVKAGTIFLVLVLILQAFSMQRSLWSLQNQMNQMQSQNEELVEAMKQLLAKQC
jgi:hypothetical protein